MDKISRYLLHFIFFYTCIEGLVINIKYPALLPYVYKDIVILLVYFFVFGAKPKKLVNPSPAVNKLMFPLFFFSSIMVIYLISADFSVGLVTLKQRLFYIPMISIGYLFVRSEKDFKNFVTLLALYAIGASIFGIYLYFVGQDGLTRLGANYFIPYYTPGAAAGIEYWRVPGTFTSPGQYGVYLGFNGLIITALLMTKSISNLQKLIACLSLILIILAMFVSGSRTPFLIFSASVAVLLLCSGKLTRIIKWGLIGYAIAAFGFSLLGSAVQTRFESIASSTQVERFQTSYFGQLFLPALLENPLGSGLGTATLGARHIIGPGKEVQLMESYLGIIAVETGILGLAAFMWICCTIGRLIFRLRRFIQKSHFRIIWYALSVHVFFTILALPVYAVLDAAPGNLYFWFSVGALIKIADIERRKKAHDLGGEEKPTGIYPKAVRSLNRPNS